jgi:hypothetical protein
VRANLAEIIHKSNRRATATGYGVGLSGSTEATSFLRRNKNMIVPNGKEIEINHAPYEGANAPEPKSEKYNGATCY